MGTRTATHKRRWLMPFFIRSIKNLLENNKEVNIIGE
jgi:hypothetical protein